MMSRYFYSSLLSFVLTSSIALAQIPNNGFEDWSGVGNCQEADRWSSTNLFDTTGSLCPVSRSGDHFPATIGNYSMRLENNVSLMPSFSAYGIVTSTRLDGSDKPLFSLGGHPNALCGYFKFYCVNHDTMSINIYLSYQGTEIAGGHFMIDSTVANWTPFLVPLSNYTTADSARITVMAANIEGAGVQGNSILYIDNFSFDTLLSGVGPEFLASGDVQFFPNPVQQQTTVQWGTALHQVTHIALLDLSGRTVQQEDVPEAVTAYRLDLSALQEGLYTVSISTLDHRAMMKKVVVAR